MGSVKVVRAIVCKSIISAPERLTVLEECTPPQTTTTIERVNNRMATALSSNLAAGSDNNAITPNCRTVDETAIKRTYLG